MLGLDNSILFGVSISLSLLVAATFVVIAQQGPRPGEGFGGEATVWDVPGALALAFAVAAWQAVGRRPPLLLGGSELFGLVLTSAVLLGSLLLALRLLRRGGSFGRIACAVGLLVATLALPVFRNFERLSASLDLGSGWLAACAALALPLAFAGVALLPRERSRRVLNVAATSALFGALLAVQAVWSWPPLRADAASLPEGAPLRDLVPALVYSLVLCGLACLLLGHRWKSARHARDRELRLAGLKQRQVLMSGDSERLLRENALRADDAELRSQFLLAGANVGSFDWDLATDRVRFGGAWAAMLGYDPSQLAPHRDAWMQLCHPEDLPVLLRRLEEHLADGRHQLVCELRMKTARRTWLWVRVQAQGVNRDTQGRPRRLVGTQTDIDEQRRVQQAEQFDRALYTSGPVRRIGFEAAPPQRVRHGSCALPLPATGEGDDEAPLAAVGQALADWVHGDDLAAFNAAASRALAEPGRPLHCELRLADAAGGWRWVMLHALADRDEQAEPGVLRGYLVDIGRLEVHERNDPHDQELQQLVGRMSTTQRFLEGLQELTEQLQLCDNTDAGRGLVERAGAALFPRWDGTLAFGDSRTDLRARWGEAAATASAAAAHGQGDCWAMRLGRMHHAVAGPEGRSVAPVCGHLGGGHDLPVGVTHSLCLPFSLGQDTPPGALQMSTRQPLADDELRQAIWGAETLAHTLRLSLGNLNLRVSLRDQAVRDWMTGLYNRRHFDEALQQELGRAARGGDNVVLALFDIDHFKSFNDAYGHEAGDEVIRAVGRQLQGFVRSYDVAARIGGEELAVLLPRAHLAETCTRLDGLRERIAAMSLSYQGLVLPPITVSIGVADIEQGPAANILQRADSAMYASKRNGRDRLTCWDPDLPTISQLAQLEETR